MATPEITLKCVKITLVKSTRLLCDNLRVDNMLLTLIAEGAVTTNDSTKIKRKDTDSEKVEELLDILARSSVSSYKVFMKALKEDRPDLYKDVKAIEEKECGVSSSSGTTGGTSTDSGQKVSDRDIFTITVKIGLTKAQLDTLFLALEISSADIDNGRSNANTNDFKLQSNQILRDGWLQKKGSAATRQVVLEALKDCGEANAVQNLAKEWKISL